MAFKIGDTVRCYGKDLQGKSTHFAGSCGTVTLVKEKKENRVCCDLVYVKCGQQPETIYEFHPKQLRKINRRKELLICESDFGSGYRVFRSHEEAADIVGNSVEIKLFREVRPKK